MNLYRIAIIIGTLELVAAIPLYGIYTAPIRFYGAIGYWEPMAVLTNILSLVFVLLPFAAVFALIKRKPVGYLWLALFPIVAFVFGVTAIPFVKYLYGTDIQFNTMIIGVINTLVVISVAWVFFANKKRSNQAI